MDKRILIIIDMQKGFKDYANKAKDGVLKHIAHARKQKWTIICVTFNDYDRLIPAVHQALKGYPYLKAPKDHNDGSQVVLDCALLFGLNLAKVRICGVCADACIKDTTRSLAVKVKNMDIELPVSATACSWVNRDVEKELRRTQNFIKTLKNGSKIRILQ